MGADVHFVIPVSSVKPGIVLITSGSGATNVVTAMQDVLSSGIALIFFSSQVATSAIISDAFQEANIISISRSSPKCSRSLLQDVTMSTPHMPLPFKATTPKWPLGLPTNPLQPKDKVSIDMLATKQAVGMTNRAQQPTIYTGNGVLSSLFSPTLLAQLSEIGSIPVTTIL